MNTVYHLSLRLKSNFPIYLLLGISMALLACKKQNPDKPTLDEPTSAVKIIDLSDKYLAYGRDFQLDLNGDKRADFLFTAFHVSYDLNTKSKLVFQLLSTTTTRVAVNTANESTPVLLKGQKVETTTYNGYEWFPVGEVILVEKFYGNGPTYWSGNFMSNSLRYLPFHLFMNGKYYSGWLEISTDTDKEQVRLHRAGIALQPDLPVIAGEQ
ncbi:hypothetical protein ACQKCH_11425 [Nubsella zeaxanthinifaciens]|uniref:hypothetical protein n=1 Tax=Nubsella zeaxanthinifaciens TaxID=392412 RepID=UPI003D06CC63